MVATAKHVTRFAESVTPGLWNSLCFAESVTPSHGAHFVNRISTIESFDKSPNGDATCADCAPAAESIEKVVTTCPASLFVTGTKLQFVGKIHLLPPLNYVNIIVTTAPMRDMFDYRDPGA